MALFPVARQIERKSFKGLTVPSNEIFKSVHWVILKRRVVMLGSNMGATSFTIPYHHFQTNLLMSRKVA
jgi:hypothetical protein